MDSRTISSNSFGDHTRIHQGNVYYASDTESPQNKVNACRNALFLADPIVDRETLKSTKGQRTAGTCEWIRDNVTYQSWLDGDSECLWISGGPGKGKTMLSIFLTEELEKHTQETKNPELLLFYFCSQDEEHNSAVAVLRGLAYQLVRKRPNLANHALSDFESPGKTQETLKSPNALWDVLEKLLQAPELGTVFCVLDGLDECDDASLRLLVDKFCAYFSKSLNPSGGRFKLAIISRKIDRLDVFPQVRLDPDNDERVNGDIRHFVASSVQRLEGIHGFDDIRKSVETTLLYRAQGTFLWVGFVMEELSKKKTCTEILETLDGIPLGLHAVYDRMLMQIESSRRSVIFEILQWVTMAVRPLTLPELAAAIHIPFTTEISSNQAIRDYITLCGHILTIHDQQVSLIHQSVRDYLLREKLDSDPRLKEFRFKEEEGHARLARTCLDCIEKSDFRHKSLGIDDASVWQKSPLLHYAAMHWPEHARRSLYADKDVNLSRPFFQKKSSVRMHWWEAYITANHMYWETYSLHVDLLHITSYLGINSVARELLTTNVWQLNQKGEDGITALSLAARGGHKATVQLLIENGANVNAEETSGWTALGVAAERGHEAVVQLLLANGADINAKDKYGYTALAKAAGEGYTAITQLLIKNSADINAKDKYGYTGLAKATGGGYTAIVQLLLANGADGKDKNALWLAAERGYMAIVQLLLANGADVNAKDKYGHIALAKAAGRGHMAVVQLLVANSADVHAKDEYGYTALARAAGGGYIAIVQLLLANGADGKDKNALWLAARGGHMAIVQLLLANGADVNVKDKYGYLALAKAAGGGHIAIVQLLLANGADINARDIYGQTALGEAARGGYMAVIQLLLANGADGNNSMALRIAAEEGHEAIVQLLRSAGKT